MSSQHRRVFLKNSARTAISMLGMMILPKCGDQNSSADQLHSIDHHLLEDDEFVTLYDMYAVATYYDGGIGPMTGTITVDMIDKNETITLKFWHGHGGKDHFFTITPEAFQSIRDLKKTWIETSTVDNHAHKLFIDPTNPRWRIPNAKPVRIKRKRP